MKVEITNKNTGATETYRTHEDWEHIALYVAMFLGIALTIASAAMSMFTASLLSMFVSIVAAIVQYWFQKEDLMMEFLDECAYEEDDEEEGGEE